MSMTLNISMLNNFEHRPVSSEIAKRIDFCLTGVNSSKTSFVAWFKLKLCDLSEKEVMALSAVAFALASSISIGLGGEPPLYNQRSLRQCDPKDEDRSKL